MNTIERSPYELTCTSIFPRLIQRRVVSRAAARASSIAFGPAPTVGKEVVDACALLALDELARQGLGTRDNLVDCRTGATVWSSGRRHEMAS